MKKQFKLFAMFMFFAMATMAFPFGNSSLELRVNEVGNYEFEIEGQLYRTQNSTVNIHQIFPGAYRVKIFKNHVYGHGRFSNVQRVMVYQDVVNVPNNTTVVASLNRYGLNVQQFRNSSNHQMNYNNSCGMNNGNQFGTYNGNRVHQFGHQNNRGNNHFGYANPNHFNAQRAMHQNEFNLLMQSINDASFDRTKVEIAKAAMQRNAMSTQQIAAIMRSLSFDSYRLDVAKAGYRNCIDQQNYHNLTREFSFDSSARALIRHIS